MADDLQTYAAENGEQDATETSPKVRWQIVPVTPTEQMGNAGNAHIGSRSALLSAWNDMINAAPDAPNEAAVSAILCAIKDHNGMHFLRTWISDGLHNNQHGGNGATEADTDSIPVMRNVTEKVAPSRETT